MYKHTFYYFLGNKKYPEIYILLKRMNIPFLYLFSCICIPGPQSIPCFADVRDRQKNYLFCAKAMEHKEYTRWDDTKFDNSKSGNVNLTPVQAMANQSITVLNRRRGMYGLMVFLLTVIQWFMGKYLQKFCGLSKLKILQIW